VWLAALNLERARNMAAFTQVKAKREYLASDQGPELDVCGSRGHHDPF
jgi:hypothetical protein